MPLVKEPHAFKKVRHKLAKVLADHAPRGVAEARSAEGAGEESGSGATSIITLRELDFLPLDVNAGEFTHRPVCKQFVDCSSYRELIGRPV